MKKWIKKFILFVIVVFSILLFLFIFPKRKVLDSYAWKPEGLKTELMEQPYGINTLSPAFSWYVNSEKSRTYQKKYRIVIANSLKNMQDETYLLDTGWQFSSENTYVKIKNAAYLLSDNQIYYWKVQIGDLEGEISEFSEVQEFSTGVGAEWTTTDGIWSNDDCDYAFFRNEFETDGGKIEKALLSVTALSPEETRQYVYNVYLNGKYVGSGPTRINGTTVYYNTYDVTELLDKNNVLGAICYTNLDRAFLCQMTFFYEDGTKEVVFNSGKDRERWRVLNGDLAYGKNEAMIGTSYYVANAENIDSTYYPTGWLNYGYDTTVWEIPVATKYFEQKQLVPYESENMEKYSVDPVEVRYIGDGRYFVDFGKEIVGGISLNLFNWKLRPTEIVLRYGEELNEDGTVKYQMRTGNIYEEKWTFARGRQAYENIGLKTFRYLDIYTRGISISKKDIKGIALRQAFDDKESSFFSSEPLLNQLYELTKYTIKATNQNLYVDSQSRERGAYEGDVWINMLAAYAFEDDYTLPRISSEYLYANRTWPAEYPMYGIMCAWQDYMYTGNKDSLVENYTFLKSHIDAVVIDPMIGLVKNSYDEIGYNRPLVDWPETERAGYAYDDATYNTVLNAVICEAFNRMADIAQLVGDSEGAETYKEAGQNLKEAMICYLYNKEFGAFSDGLDSDYQRIEHYTQHATAYALYASIYDEPVMENSMIEYLKKDGTIKMSVFGAYFLLQGLYDHNAGNYATELLLENDPKNQHTWAHMLYKEKATITAEAWSSEIKDNMTYSHPWGASPAAFITRGIFGIKPTEPGFSSFEIKLQPGTIERASIKVPTIKGSIEISYNLGKTSTIKVTIPSNTNSVIMIPEELGNTGQITVNEKAMAFNRIENYLLYKLEPGVYIINIKGDK